LTETETRQAKIMIDANGLRYEASGTVEEITPQALQFLAQAVPTFDLARRLLYVPNLAGLADEIVNYAKMTNNGELLLTRNDLSADKAILIVLFMAHLAAKTSKRESDSVSIGEIANGVGKSSKTIRNVIVNLQKSGLIGRADRGRYKATPKGLMHLETTFANGSKVKGVAEQRPEVH
jgi:Holliday junction resolvasome RuvABC ATP-dependent DNA helicase subunit